jgi:hypothetical protein
MNQAKFKKLNYFALKMFMFVPIQIIFFRT